jgi:predicted protein tyrosine phosphatase
MRPAIRVGGLHTIDADLLAFRPTHLIGILDPAMAEPAAYAAARASADMTLLRFLDHDRPEEGPAVAHVEASLAAIDRAVAAARAGPARLFIHCHAGASRSTATAYLALVRQHGTAAAEAAFAELLAITNKPWPNRRLVALADELLTAGGGLLAPLDAYRAAHPQRPRAYLRLHLARARQDPGYGARLGVAAWPIRASPRA